MTMFAFMGAVEAGLIFGLVAIGVYLSFRVLDFPDLTVDGSFPLGAAVATVAITSGWSPWLATLLAVLAGFGAGVVTAQLHIRLKILHLLASILVMLALYSINLRIMGRPNMPLLNAETVFDPVRALPVPGYVAVPIAMVLVVILAKFALDWFLSTEIGLGLRAAGANERMASAQGIDRNRMLPLGLGISNGFVGLAGALFAQSQGFADVGMGVGIIIVGLAAVIVGETIVGPRTVFLATLGAVIGSVVYRVVLAFALNLDSIGLRAQDLNLVTAGLIVAAIAFSRARKAGLGRKKPAVKLAKERSNA